MKKVFAILAATVLFAGMASAQLGINVGYAPQSYTETTTISGNSGTSYMNLNGFFAGVNYNIKLTGDFGLSLGANYRFNIGEEDETLLGVKIGTYKYTQSLVDVPILFNFGFNITDNFKISPFVGPTFSIALAGNTHYTNTAIVNTETDNDWYGDNGTMKQFDIAATAGVNVQFNGIRLFGGVNFGLLDLGKDGSGYTYDVKASNWFIGLGYSL